MVDECRNSAEITSVVAIFMVRASSWCALSVPVVFAANRFTSAFTTVLRVPGGTLRRFPRRRRRRSGRHTDKLAETKPSKRVFSRRRRGVYLGTPKVK